MHSVDADASPPCRSCEQWSSGGHTSSRTRTSSGSASLTSRWLPSTCTSSRSTVCGMHTSIQPVSWHPGEEDSDGEDENIECVACDKTFKTEKSCAAAQVFRALTRRSWQSHQRSKKHIRAVELLKEAMLAEDALASGLQSPSELETPHDAPAPAYVPHVPRCLLISPQRR